MTTWNPAVHQALTAAGPYLWHGTIPFRGAIARTTIAFDLVPVD